MAEFGGIWFGKKNYAPKLKYAQKSSRFRNRRTAHHLRRFLSKIFLDYKKFGRVFFYIDSKDLKTFIL